MKLKIPDFLKHVDLSVGQRRLLTKPMANWITAGKHISSKGLSVPLVEKMLVHEMQREKPRENMIVKLMSRYNSARRAEVMREINKLIEHPDVIRTKPRKGAS